LNCIEGDIIPIERAFSIELCSASAMSTKQEWLLARAVATYHPYIASDPPNGLQEKHDRRSFIRLNDRAKPDHARQRK
jgi:hypothetical protein